MNTIIAEILAAQKEGARKYEEKRLAGFVWSSIKVKYCADQKEWIVYAIPNPKHHSYDTRERKVIDGFRLRKDAIEEAKLYAFSTDCGPMRAPYVDIYRKDGVWIDSINPKY